MKWKTVCVVDFVLNCNKIKHLQRFIKKNKHCFGTEHQRNEKQLLFLSKLIVFYLSGVCRAERERERIEIFCSINFESHAGPS